jgi:hypothetical protein
MHALTSGTCNNFCSLLLLLLPPGKQARATILPARLAPLAPSTGETRVSARRVATA